MMANDEASQGHRESPRRAVVIGASAGGVTALLEVAKGLPPGLDVVVGMVLHVGNHPSSLPALLTRQGPWPAVHPVDGQALRAGTIYVAPPDHHMLFTRTEVRVIRGPRENHTRPALDPLFRSTAIHWRELAIGVVLTGTLDDGTAGLAAIKDCGGLALVQDPSTAFEPGMPQSALDHVEIDHSLPLEEIAPALVRLAGAAPPSRSSPAPVPIVREQAIFEGSLAMQHLAEVAEPSAMTCPDCGGGLWELKDSKPLRYRCHTGHAFTVRALGSAQADAAEHALWSGMRALRERELLLSRLAGVAEAKGDAGQAEVHRRDAERVRGHAEELGKLARGDWKGA